MDSLIREEGINPSHTPAADGFRPDTLKKTIIFEMSGSTVEITQWSCLEACPYNCISLAFSTPHKKSDLVICLAPEVANGT